jgi:hypothetical protein
MRRRALLNNAFLCLGLMLTACATPKPVGNFQRDPAYNKKLDRVLVVSMNPALVDENVNRRFSSSETEKLIALLKTRGVETQVTSVNAKAGDAKDEILQAALRFQPHEILYFGPTHGHHRVLMSRGWNSHVLRDTVDNLTFRAKLVDVSMSRTVWHGDMSYSSEPEPETVAEQLVDRLGKDNLLPAAQ